MALARLMLVLAAGLATGSSCRDRAEPLEVWLTTGMGPAQVVYPRALAYRPADQSLVVIDRMARVQRIDREGKFITAWRMPDHALGKPTGVSVGPDGNIYVPDTHYHRVIVYTPDGTEIRRWGRAGRGPGEFIYPTDVAFDATGRVYVSEYGDNDRIQVFDGEGNYLREFGQFGEGDGELSRPQSMVIVGEEVFVADACNHRIAVFTIEGDWVRSIGSAGTAPGRFRFPYGLDIDRNGHLIVCEFGNNRVQRIDRMSGESLGVWGQAGRGEGELAYPWAAVGLSDGRVAVIDSGNNRVQLFRW
jgi:DNA-binding beta-propeller fold protein YncE